MWASMPPASPMTDGRGAEPVQDPERHKPGSCTRLQLGVAIVAVLLLRLAVRACIGRRHCRGLGYQLAGNQGDPARPISNVGDGASVHDWHCSLTCDLSLSPKSRASATWRHPSGP